ncbi:MAG: inositol monophosphatase [Halanaeroarchaeum sp.]
MTGRETRFAVAERAAREGAAVACESFRRDLAVETKANKNDVVTQADRDAQARVAEIIGETFPGDVVVGEEGDGPKRVPDEGAAWVVDPIDGTANYVRGNPTWGTSVAAVVDGETVAAANVFPALSDVYLADGRETTLNGSPARVSARTDPETFAVEPSAWWPRERREEYARAFRRIGERFGDARRFGCSQASLSMVASGQLEGVFTNRRSYPWDTVAGVHMIRQAGGEVTNLAGDPWEQTDGGLVASNGIGHDDVLAAARDVKRARTDR